MPFNIKPNPSVYARLAAQWEDEESRRQQEAAKSYFATKKNHFLILFVLLVVLFQLSILLYGLYTRGRVGWIFRSQVTSTLDDDLAAWQVERKQWQAHARFTARCGKDVENIIVEEWEEAHASPNATKLST